MARTKVEKIPVLRDWSAVDAALQEMRECRFSLTELDVEQKRRIDDLKGQYKERETALQNRYKRLAAEVEEYVSAHRAELTGKSRRLKFGVVGYRLSNKSRRGGHHRTSGGHGTHGAHQGDEKAGPCGADASAC